MFNNFEKVNFSNMTDVALARWIHDNSYYEALKGKISLAHCLYIARMVKAAYRIGELRGNILKK